MGVYSSFFYSVGVSSGTGLSGSWLDSLPLEGFNGCSVPSILLETSMLPSILVPFYPPGVSSAGFLS